MPAIGKLRFEGEPAKRRPTDRAEPIAPHVQRPTLHRRAEAGVVPACGPNFGTTGFRGCGLAEPARSTPAFKQGQDACPAPIPGAVRS